VSGLMSVTGDPDGPPTKVGAALLDLLAGLGCALGALAALVGRGRVGSVEVSLVEVGVTSLANVLANHLASGEEPQRHGNAHPNIVPYQAFAAADGEIVVAVGNDRQFAALLTVLGMEDGDGRFASNPARVARREELIGVLGAAIAARGRDELLTALAAADVPAGPVNRVGEAVELMERDGPWTQEVEGIRTAPNPIRIDGARLPARLPPPRLGEHTAEVLGALGDR
jgi:crotonobetainyl-CoA:carnitine CoA-transferase CaiB-like acyl-CoA transferase